MLLFFASETICYAVFAEGGNTNTEAAPAVIAFIFLFFAAYDLAFTPLIVSYTLEILPYSLRAKGFTVFSLAISLSAMFNTYINPIALGKYYMLFFISEFDLTLFQQRRLSGSITSFISLCWFPRSCSFSSSLWKRKGSHWKKHQRCSMSRL